MAESGVHPTPNEEPELVGGEIVEIKGDRIRVRLDSGLLGFVAPSEGTKPAELRVGLRATFHVVMADVDGSPTLAFAVSQETPTAKEPFDREVVRLHNALATHHPTNSIRPAPRVHLGEEQIPQWIRRVESRLGRLRKNRAKRLDEEFYNSS